MYVKQETTKTFNYILKVNNKIARVPAGIYLLMETIKQGVNLNNLTPCSSISIINFKHAIARWVNMFKYYDNYIQSEQ